MFFQLLPFLSPPPLTSTLVVQRKCPSVWDSEAQGSDTVLFKDLLQMADRQESSRKEPSCPCGPHLPPPGLLGFLLTSALPLPTVQD